MKKHVIMTSGWTRIEYFFCC